ncbi:unnamed protein product, partial [Porites lobata]
LFSKVEVGIKAANCASASIKISEDLGFLDLGRIDQDYIKDPDLREILADTKLDINKAEVFEDKKLRLITSVIYSERFEIKGKIESKMEVDGEVNVPVHPLAQLKAKIGKCKIPPKIARRNTRGPFLFKCCRVIYNKEKNRLELPRGELVGKTIFRGDEDDEDDEEYKNSAVSLEDGEETNLTDSFTTEDSAKLEDIKKSVLMPSKNREERKERVKKYLQWFVEALTTGKKSLSLDEPLTDEDCQFLRSIFVPAIKDRSTFSLPKNFDEEKIQGYAIVLKIISDLSEESWDEIEKAWAEEEEHLEDNK